MDLTLPTTYYGPISWYRQLNSADTCYIDAKESFRKRTFRNRCEIASPNGRQTLTVPVEHKAPLLFPQGGGATEWQANEGSAFASSPPLREKKGTITAFRISEHNKWRHVHWQALETAYGNSPFFDYYVDDIRPFFEPNWEYLFDLNFAIIQKMCELLQIDTRILKSDDRIATPCHPVPEPWKTSPTALQEAPLPASQREYYQAHAHRTGFLPDLSILDLLFNMGNESILYL